MAGKTDEPKRSIPRQPTPIIIPPNGSILDFYNVPTIATSFVGNCGCSPSNPKCLQKQCGCPGGLDFFERLIDCPFHRPVRHSANIRITAENVEYLRYLHCTSTCGCTWMCSNLCACNMSKGGCLYHFVGDECDLETGVVMIDVGASTFVRWFKDRPYIVGHPDSSCGNSFVGKCGCHANCPLNCGCPNGIQCSYHGVRGKECGCHVHCLISCECKGGDNSGKCPYHLSPDDKGTFHTYRETLSKNIAREHPDNLEAALAPVVMTTRKDLRKQYKHLV